METAGKLAGFAVCAALVGADSAPSAAGSRVGRIAGRGRNRAAGGASGALGAGARDCVFIRHERAGRQLHAAAAQIAGLSLLLDFAAQTCRDAQEEALALKVEFTGRVLLLSSALPVLQALLSQLVSLPLS